MERIAECYRALSRWKRSTFSNLKNKINSLREHLETEGTKRNPNLQAMKSWRSNLADSYWEEEVYWKHKGREK